MRKILLASAALVVFGAGNALAVGPVQDAEFTITSSLDESCSIAVAPGDEDIDIGPAMAVTGTGNFSTTCNFEDAMMTVTFVSTNGGVKNTVENVTVDYNIAYGLGSSTALATTTTPLSVIAAPGGSAGSPVPRTFSVGLVSDIVVAGDYTDTLTVTVAP